MAKKKPSRVSKRATPAPNVDDELRAIQVWIWDALATEQDAIREEQLHRLQLAWEKTAEGVKTGDPAAWRRFELARASTMSSDNTASDPSTPRSLRASRRFSRTRRVPPRVLPG
jgi:hypothetical protein